MTTDKMNPLNEAASYAELQLTIEELQDQLFQLHTAQLATDHQQITQQIVLRAIVEQLHCAKAIDVHRLRQDCEQIAAQLAPEPDLQQQFAHTLDLLLPSHQ
ncbi:hypothetical protein A1D24_03155 [Testudinibacter aquarius]|uniref:Uncharacterized protein n=1 Tax=Testudinibacter aquarius TaxID=1524974 RepID=A0A4R3Y606_9PAST|nr:hypothetical protein A1D24_03155 [Testudinibacter aquarius]TCV87236.1 hypothetical protein EDC16_105155 [Testudinibacter aquarius]